MQKYIDAHCHILSPAQMASANDCGVGRFIVNSTHRTDWATIAKMVNGKSVYGAIGIHPWFVSEIDANWDDEMVNTLARNPHLMVGEIGLDKNHPNMPAQELIFRRGLQIAHDMGRVAHVHCVGCWGKCVEILHASALPPTVVFHCFSGSPELASELSHICNAYFSFGSSVLNTKSTRTRTAVASVPGNRILVESDAMDVATPTIIPDVVREIAKIRGVDNDAMADTIYANTMGLLK